MHLNSWESPLLISVSRSFAFSSKENCLREKLSNYTRSEILGLFEFYEIKYTVFTSL
jgi:hypothetical protein